MLGGGHPTPLPKHKAGDKWPNFDRSHGQVEASLLRFFSELILKSEELRKGGRERNGERKQARKIETQRRTFFQ